MKKNNISKSKVLEANIEVHSALANSGEYDQSPHFKPENKLKVRGHLKRVINMSPNTSDSKLLDIGCGTGFIIHLVSDLVKEIDGVDITEDMMKNIDLSSGNISLKLSQAEDLPFADNTFDIATAYSFMDHLLDYRLVLDEAYRVLKEGGVYYSDLNPNKGFSDMLKGIENNYDDSVLPFSISREINGMLHNGEYHNEQFGLNEESLTNAEPEKSINGGFDYQEVLAYASKIGFTDVKCELDWFLGQGVLMNSDSDIDLEMVESYLQSTLPASQNFYKYLRFIFVK